MNDEQAKLLRFITAGLVLGLLILSLLTCIGDF